MSRLLLTGAAGFIGLHLYEKLIAKHSVAPLDNLSDSNHVSKFRAGKLEGLRNISILDDFLSNEDQLPEMVIHLAAETGISASLHDPLLYYQKNITGTMNVLEQCRKRNIKYLVYASSSSVYNPNQEIMTEDSLTSQQLSFYGTSKKMCELLVENYCRQFGITAVALRFFTVYGSWVRPDMAAYKFMQAIDKNEEIVLYNNGNVQRDFTHVSDVVNSIEAIVDNISSLEKNQQHIFNISGSNPVSVHEYAALIAKSMNKPLYWKNMPLPPSELEKTHGDSSRLLRFTGNKPSVRIEAGVEEMVQWFLKHRYA